MIAGQMTNCSQPGRLNVILVRRVLAAESSELLTVCFWELDLLRLLARLLVLLLTLLEFAVFVAVEVVVVTSALLVKPGVGSKGSQPYSPK